MKIKDALISLGLMIGGMSICSINYYIVRYMLNIGTWLAELLNAPAGVGMGITILCLIPLFGILLAIGIIGGFFIFLGLRILIY